MTDECIEWLHECRRVFPKLDKYTLPCEYSRLPKNILGRTKGKIIQHREIDPEALLLSGKRKIKGNKKISGEFEIKINPLLKKIPKKELRKQVVQSIMIHELLHIERKDLLTLSKDYKRRKTKRIHTKSFDREVFERYNQLRELNKIPRIKNKEDLDLAINKILSEVKK